MDTFWVNNKKRFLDKIDIVDASFCTTDPSVLGFSSKYKIHFLPNPVDFSFDKLKNFNVKKLNNDVFCNESWST